MQALILAGGEGTRLRPLTNTVPKPVLPLANRPFVSYMLDWLASHGFDDFVMSCGFLADGVRSVLGDGDRDGIRIRYIDEPEPLGTAGAVKFGEDVLAERFAVLNGDVLTDLDITGLWRSHEERGARATLALIAVDDPSAYGLVTIAADGAVEEFREKPEPGTVDRGLINAGAYVLERDVLAGVPPGRAVSFEREVFPSLVGNGLYALEVGGYWLDIGTPQRYLQGTRDILSGRVRTGVDLGPDGLGIAGGAQIDPGAHLTGPLLVGAGAEVSAGVQLGPNAVIAEGCRIAGGAHVEDAVLHSGVRLEPGAIVRESIVGARARVGAKARVESCSIVGAESVVDDGAELAGARV